MKTSTLTNGKASKEVEDLKSRLAEAEETLSAIYRREVDALIVGGPKGEQVFTLQGAESSYRLLVEAMNEGALTLGPEGTVLYCNRRFAEMIDSPIEQVIGSPWRRFFPPDESPRVGNFLAGAATCGDKHEFTIQSSDGSLSTVQLSARPLELDGRDVLAVLVTDIAELKAAHHALHLANEQLESRVRERTRELAEANEILRAEMMERAAAERALAEAQAKLRQHADNLERHVEERTAKLRDTVAELEAFSYTVSHDLRAPLRSVQSFSQILLEDCAHKLNEEELDYLRRVVSSANNLDKLIQDVLVYSRATHSSLTVRPVRIYELLRGVIASTHSLQPPAAQVTLEGDFPVVLAHEGSLTQCIANLLDNAIKFIPPKTAPQINVRAEDRGQDSRVWFEDNGIGIALRDQERIFNIFERVHSVADFPGTGIGLSIVKRVIERMGGTVGVESKLTCGSRFWIQLPRAKDV
jgi:PAS domain S-box-containing protein